MAGKHHAVSTYYHVLELKASQKYSNRAISKLVGVPRGTVEEWLYRKSNPVEVQKRVEERKMLPLPTGRRCLGCNEYKDRSEFGVKHNQSGRAYLKARCRVCLTRRVKFDAAPLLQWLGESYLLANGYPDDTTRKRIYLARQRGWIHLEVLDRLLETFDRQDMFSILTQGGRI